MAKKKVVIIGGGFAGLNLAKKLTDHPLFDVLMVDKNNYHFFPPLIYQVATAFIEPSNISYPFRRMFQHKNNLRFHLGVLQHVDTARNQIETDTGSIPYDYLVLALGTESNYFGMDNVKKFALPMKTIDDALHLRNCLLQNIEKATRITEPAEREKMLNVVIAGGGPTGVELAGMLAEMGRNVGAKDYPEIRGIHSNIHLVDSGSALLGPMSKKSQEEAYKVLRNLGVNVILNTAVKDYVNESVLLSDGRTIPTPTLIWASGVIAREVPGIPADSLGRGRRILVDECNRVKGTANVFALGDLSFQTSDEKFPNGHPQLAQVAIQQGVLLARNLAALEKGESTRAFTYKDKGSMAIISKFKAVVDLPKGFFKGIFAWFVWLFIHIIPIAGYRNKAKLAYNWFWSFITNDPTLRLIIRPRKS